MRFSARYRFFPHAIELFEQGVTGAEGKSYGIQDIKTSKRKTRN